MQHMFTLTFKLQGRPSEYLLEFTEATVANIVLPSKSFEGSLSSSVKNFHHMTIYLPNLRRQVTFSTSDSIEKIRGNTVIYNLACTTRSYVIIHLIDFDANQLVIKLITDNDKDYKLVKKVYDRFFSLDDNEHDA